MYSSLVAESEEPGVVSASESGGEPFGRPGAELSVSVGALSPEGDGVAEMNGHEIVVPGAFPGEQVRARVDARSRHHARLFTTVLELQTPHPARREAPCEHHPSRGGHCTGCPLLTLGETAQREAKAELVRSRFGLTIDRWEFAPDALEYRWSSKRVASRKRGQFVLGSYRRGPAAR